MNVRHGVITGPWAIVFGVIMLIASFVQYWISRYDRRISVKRWRAENKLFLKKRKRMLENEKTEAV